MTKDLEDLQASSELEDEIRDDWSTFISHKEKYKRFALPSVAQDFDRYLELESIDWGSSDDSPELEQGIQMMLLQD